MQAIKCFEVMGHTDTTEGRGPLKVVARFSTYEVAEQYVKSKAYSRWCVMGCQSADDIKKIHEATVMVLDTVGELEQMYTEEVRARALSKLSAEERKVLGL